MKCPNCNREVYGFWKHGKHPACSLACYRKLVNTGSIPKLNLDQIKRAGNAELGLLSDKQFKEM